MLTFDRSRETKLVTRDGDGLDLVAEAKRLHGLKAIAVTAITEQERGLRAGYDFYLTKPVDFYQLRCALGIPPRHSTASPELA